MTDPARGPTTEELRARVLAHESRERAEAGAARGSAGEGVRPDSASAARGLGVNVPLAAHPPPRDLHPEGRTFYDPARPPLDSKGAERQ